MIKFEKDNSQFFVANKNYCETIQNKLKTINLDCSGWCNSFGYDIETSLEKNGLKFHIKFLKHQSKQNGIIIPVNALNYAGIEMAVTGLNKEYNVRAGKSSLRRLFISKALKSKIPSPYYIKFNYTPDTNLVESLFSTILKEKISEFKLNNGKLFCKIHTQLTDPLNLITDIEKITKHWT